MPKLKKNVETRRRIGQISATNSNVSQTRVCRRRLWGSGAKPLAAGLFFVSFCGKLAILMPLDHILHVFRAILNTKFLTFESQLKKLNWSILLLLTI